MFEEFFHAFQDDYYVRGQQGTKEMGDLGSFIEAEIRFLRIFLKEQEGFTELSDMSSEDIWDMEDFVKSLDKEVTTLTGDEAKAFFKAVQSFYEFHKAEEKDMEKKTLYGKKPREGQKPDAALEILKGGRKRK